MSAAIDVEVARRGNDWIAYVHGTSAPILRPVPGNAQPASAATWASVEKAELELPGLLRAQVRVVKRDGVVVEYGHGPGHERCADEEVRVCCGARMTWDPFREGYTCGGLHLAGWWTCAACNKGVLCRASRPAENWKLAGGGRSVEIGTARIRVEKCDDPNGLMERIVRVPQYEKVLRAIAAGASNAQELAAAMLPADPSSGAAVVPGPELDASAETDEREAGAEGEGQPEEAEETPVRRRRSSTGRRRQRGKGAHTGDLFGAALGEEGAAGEAP